MASCAMFNEVRVCGGPAFFSVAVCIPQGGGRLDWSWALEDDGAKASGDRYQDVSAEYLDEIAEQARYKKLRSLVEPDSDSPYALLDLAGLAPHEEPKLVRKNTESPGAPIDLDLRWAKSIYSFDAPDDPVRATGIGALSEDESLWREFGIVPRVAYSPPNNDASVAVYSTLAAFAIRRSWLMSFNAQRRCYRIAMPWAVADIDGANLLLVPIITLIAKKRSTGFRRTLVVTVLLVPPAKGGIDLRVFHGLRKGFETLTIDDNVKTVKQIEGLAGPLATFLEPTRPLPESIGLDELFDLVAKRALKLFKTVPVPKRSASQEEASLGTLVSIARTRSAIAGIILNVSVAEGHDVYDALTRADSENSTTREALAASLSSDTWTHGPLENLHFDAMRLGDSLQSSSNGATLFNPLSRTFVHAVRANEDYLKHLGWWMVPWFCLLAESVCSASEMIRTYRNAIEPLSRLEHLPECDAIMRQMVESMDYIYSIECSPLFKAMQDEVMRKSGLRRDHGDLLREIEVNSEMLRAEKVRTLETAIVNTSVAVRNLTGWIVALTILSVVSSILLLFITILTRQESINLQSELKSQRSQTSAPAKTGSGAARERPAAPGRSRPI